MVVMDSIPSPTQIHLHSAPAKRFMGVQYGASGRRLKPHHLLLPYPLDIVPPWADTQQSNWSKCGTSKVSPAICMQCYWFYYHV